MRHTLNYLLTLEKINASSVRVLLLITVFLPLLLISCKKKTMVLIQAKDYITGDGSAYANQPYTILEKWTPVFEAKVKTVATGFLNDKGQASVELKLNKNRSYSAGVENPEGICFGGLSQYSIGTDKENNIEFDFLKCGFVNFQFNNINCESDDDKFRLRYQYEQDPEVYRYYGYAGGDNYDWNPELFIGGCHSYFGDFSEIRPLGKYSVEWQVERSSGLSEGSGTFILTENDTTTFLIEY